MYRKLYLRKCCGLHKCWNHEMVTLTLDGRPCRYLDRNLRHSRRLIEQFRCIPCYNLLYRSASYYYSSSRLDLLHRVPLPHNIIDGVTLNQVQLCTSKTLPINFKQNHLTLKQDNSHYWQERIAIISTFNLSLYMDPISILDTHIMSYISGSHSMQAYIKAIAFHLNSRHLGFVYSEKLILYYFLLCNFSHLASVECIQNQ